MVEVIETKEWKPNSRKQEIFLSLPDAVFEALYGGAAGGGKSEILLMLPIVRGFIQYPRFKGILFRRTYPELEREMIPRSHEFYSAAGGRYNDQKKLWDFPSGARLFFGHIEAEKDVKKYDTAEFNYEGYDELTSFTEYQYTYVGVLRCRSSSDNLPAIVRSATNPGNIGHGWVKKKFNIDKVPPGTIQRDKVTKNLKVFVQAFLTDNPNIDSGYSQRLELLPEAEKRAKKYGDWSIFEGQVFSEFRLDPLPDEPPNAKHVISPIEIPEWWPKILAMDWGYAAFAYCLWGALSPQGRVILYREQAVKKQYIEKWIAEASYRSQGEAIVDIPLDPSAWQNRGQPKTIHQQIYEALPENLSSKLRKADNDRVGGKVLIHDFLRWEVRPKRFDAEIGYDDAESQRILRVLGIDAYNRYIEHFKGDVEEDISVLPKLQIFEDLEVLIDCIGRCVYDENNKEDVKEFDGDDPYDTLRYLIKAVEFYLKGAVQESENRQKEAEIESKFEQTHDYHAYHMRMARLKEYIEQTEGPVQKYQNRRRPGK